ncbi:MAG: MazG family protein [Clostridia bacterium]|nr:MazG family protein [Clostridia bacterium]MBR5006904.1 MazG family protein [Clostridia bacterium]
MLEIPKKKNGVKYDMEELREIVEKLRGPGGCPWDREQTHYSLIKPMIEEAYEAVDAIEKNDVTKMTEEFGDVLLQVLFHASVGRQNGEFDLEDITDRCARKMLSRHTHIFGTQHADNPAEALANWEAAKIKEKGFTSLYQDLCDIPEVFPALMRAQKAAKKIRKAGDSCADANAFGGGNCCGENGSFPGNIDFSDEKQVGRLLFEICRRAEENGVECELALKRETDGVIRSKKEN